MREDLSKMDKDELYFSLIARCAIRDQKALKELYQMVGPYLNKVAFNIVKSEDLSNDVLQEGFIQIWNNAGQYRIDKAKPITWMTSIIRYRALDRLAKEKKHSDKIVANNNDEGDHLDQFESDDKPEISAIKSQDSSILLECLETLNDRTKESISLAYLQGYSRDDIATKFNTSTNTVKSWLKRGAERLKTCIQSKEGAII
jgi:RNA polymerase sigma-70 factor (ECF subfamily)